MAIKPFHTVGIGVTFSPNLEANICEASRLCAQFNAKLVLIHVGEESEEKDKAFKEILNPFIKDDLSYSIIFKSGDPVEVILSISKQEQIDLLIVGALKKENFFKYYTGSIARKITRQATCSVLLLLDPSVTHTPYKHIVVNGLEDPKTKQTISSAFYVAKHLKSEKITIVEEISQQEVAVTIEDDKSLRQSNLVKERLMLIEDSRVKKIINEVPATYKEEISIKTQPIFGKRGYSIGHYAQVVRADLLLMNAPIKISFWQRLFPHDIEYILTELPTNVLIIR